MLRHRALLRRLWRQVPDTPARITVHWVVEPDADAQEEKDEKEEGAKAGEKLATQPAILRVSTNPRKPRDGQS